MIKTRGSLRFSRVSDAVICPAASLLLFCLGCASTPRPEMTATGVYIIGVQAGSAPMARLRSDGFPFKKIAETPAPPMLLHTLDLSEETAIEWYVCEDPVALSAAGAEGIKVETGWDRIYAELTSPLGFGVFEAARSTFSDGNLYWEPEFDVLVAQGKKAGKEPPAKARAPAAGAGLIPTARVNEKPSTFWPRDDDPTWHLGADYTQLADARGRVNKTKTGEPWQVRICHIDTGYMPSEHVCWPPNLKTNLSANLYDVDSPDNPIIGNAQDPLTTTGESWTDTFFPAQPGHGSGTLSILSSGQVDLDVGNGEIRQVSIGGAPDAEVFEVRVSPTVAHWNSKRLALAIDYAVSNKADVISLSHGGLPSHILTKVINKSYDGGTAIFAASGDFYIWPTPVRWILPWWIPRSTPKRTVYPASYTRVMSVVGATKDGRSYGKDPGFWSSFLFWRWIEWSMRGSYGPDSVMSNAISAYAPNVVWGHYSSTNGPIDLIDLDGAGTSSATPQVAAAAAIWLEYYYTNAALRSQWRSWQKVQNVYDALYASAEKDTAEGEGTFRYFGGGILRASDALDIPPSDAVKRLAESDASLPEFVIEALIGFWLEPNDIEAWKKALLKRSVTLELAQIAALNGLVNDRLLELVAAGGGDRNASRALWKAILKDRYASKFLRGQCANALEQQR